MDEIEVVDLIPFDAGRHGACLADWLTRPHVTRWWGELDVAEVRRGHDAPGAGDALITHAGRPVGYVRWHPTTRAELDAAGLDEIPDGGIDIDIFLGDAELRGKGIAPAALRCFVERIRARRSPPLFGLCTSVANTAALRAFEKAGFRRHRRFTEGGEESWLLIDR